MWLVLAALAGACSAQSTQSRKPDTSSRAKTTRSRAGHRKRKGHNPARVRQLRHAFVASSQLRPMAQQLQTLHTPDVYAGVERYARAHSGEAADAAYLALGNAYLADQKYPEAVAALQHARKSGPALADYADYLEAKAEVAQQQFAQAEGLLTEFDTRHPDSILTGRAGLLLAQAYVGEGDPQSALKKLAFLDSANQNTAAYLLVAAQAQQMAGDHATALKLYRHLYTEYANSAESTQAVAQLQAMGLPHPFTVQERAVHAEGLAKAGNYTAAAVAYRALAENPEQAGSPDVNLYLAKATLNDYRQQHHVDASQLARLSDTNDDAGALRLYLMLELARDNTDAAQVQALLQQMQQRFAQSRWMVQALYSAGNMALVANDMPTAIQDYGALASNFPTDSRAYLSHWHAAWLTYRRGDKNAAALLFEEQIARYPEQPQVAAAIYWRGRIYQDVEKNNAAAVACYNTLIAKYHHYYYAEMARKQLAGFPGVSAATLPYLEHLPAPRLSTLTVDVPSDDEHVLRAGLLANAGLNQYIAPEIQASPDSAEWAAYAEAQIYSSYGETIRSLHAMKRSVHSYFAVSINQIPRGYWVLLFPKPDWQVLTRNAKANGLDPYLVASLIRQESEFDPGAVSYANAYGLMQLLPSEGRELAHNAHVRHFQTASLLNPDVNLQLGTIYLRQLLDEFNGQTEYALAAYNAGDDRVKSWLALGPYADIPEFVESIPFTQTREYVQAILRNAEIYRRLYETAPATETTSYTAEKK